MYNEIQHGQHHTEKRIIIRNHQNGAALVMSMLMIFALSLLGMSSMRTSSLEGRMVTNMVEKDLTLQAAESASELAFADDQVLASTICQPDATVVSSPQIERNGALTTNASVRYDGETLAVGYSLDAGFATLRFSAIGEATLNASGTNTKVTQGLYVLGANGASGGC